jgi:hypothetical protein
MKNKVERYLHHDTSVYVIKKVKGKHRDHCLCWTCGRFFPGDEENCLWANMLYTICRMKGGPLVTPVYECENYFKKGEE